MIDGKNIRLRSLTKKDLAKTFKWHNDLELKNLTLSHPFPVTDSQEEEWINSIIKDKSNKTIYFGIEDKSRKILIGIIFLSRINFIHQTSWLGVFIGDKNARGKGYGKEAVRLGIDIGFQDLKLHRLEAGIEPKNKRSIALAKSIGLKREGFSKNRLFLRGQWLDMVLYVARSEDFGIEWKSQKQKKMVRF